MTTRFRSTFHDDSIRGSTGAFVAASVAACLATLALAGPPLETDDPETLDKGKFELNTAYTMQRTARDAAGVRTSDQETPLFDLAFGFAEGIQLKFEMPLRVLAETGAPTQVGIGDASFGSKLRLLREDEAPFALSIYPAVGIPFGNASDGLGTGSTSVTLPVEIGRHFLDDALFIYGDLGFGEEFADNEADGWFMGIAAEFTVVDGVTLCGELRREIGVGLSTDDSFYNAGVKLRITDSASFIGAAGQSFNPTVESGAQLRVYAGMQWTF